MSICKECQATFSDEKGLHKHLRKHGLKVKNYYEKFYPKVCLQTGKKLQWKIADSLQEYLSRDFIDKTALNLYFSDRTDTQKKTDRLLAFIQKSYDRHNLLPCQAEFASLPLAPNYLIFNKWFDINKLIAEKCYKTRFDYTFDYNGKLPLTKIDIEKFCVNIDSREQLKYRFYSSIVGPLSAGDYTLSGELFNGIVIERKNIADFGGTMVKGNERFRNELDRVRAAGHYLIVLVEFNLHELYKHKFYGYTNPSFISHKMRALIREYSDCMQVVFGVRREVCASYTAQFLLAGQSVKTIDLQLWCDYQNSKFREEEFTKEDLLRLYDNSF